MHYSLDSNKQYAHGFGVEDILCSSILGWNKNCFGLLLMTLLTPPKKKQNTQANLCNHIIAIAML